MDRDLRDCLAIMIDATFFGLFIPLIAEK